MYSGRSRTRTDKTGPVAVSHREQRAATFATAQIEDNRATTSQIKVAQAIMQFAGWNNRKRRNIERSLVKGKSLDSGLNRKVAEYGANWEVLEISDYLIRHQLKQKRRKSIAGQSVLYLSDGSLIVVDKSQYWRHESGSQGNAYFDSSHAANVDESKTHFWTRKGYSVYNGFK